MKKNKINIFLILFFSIFISPAAGLGDTKFFLGKISVEDLLKEYPVFSKTPKLKISNTEYVIDNDIKVLVFFGTWCHDSKREIPKLLKILQNYGLSEDNLDLIAVGPDKNDPMNKAAEYNLIYTPTIIFLKNFKEVGRIIEKPKKTLEIDMMEILSLQ